MTRKISVLPPPPVDRMKELYQQVEQRIKELHGNYELSNQAVTRKIEGEQGWSATLRVGGSHILQEGLEELGDWWEENARQAVLECPEPENARRQSITKAGRHRILRTVAWRHSASADIVAPSGQWCPVGINISLDFDGQAILRDIIWPIDIQEMGNTITKTMQSALGKGWQAFHHNRQRSKKMRIFEDWSGSTPAERKILGKQPPLIRKPSAVWPAESQKVGTLRVCEGMDECGYEPKLDLTPWRLSGCNQAWINYSKMVFQAFQEANPDLQFRKGTPRCLLEAGEKRHSCHGAFHQGPSRGQLDDWFLRQHELARFPDGRKIMISQPNLDRNGDEDKDETRIRRCLESWQELLPGVTLQMGGSTRSWYYPGISSLVIIGTAEIIERVNTSYEIQAGSEPSGCVHWRK